ncbi:MAG TPA: di-heme oxidoredictase family protein [Methylocella sp.]
MESRTIRYGVTAFAALLLALGGSASSQAQPHDMGPRPADPGDGQSLPGLPVPLQKLFAAGQEEFKKRDQVVEDGLGPRMNLDSCRGCHSQPAIGGSSPALSSTPPCKDDEPCNQLSFLKELQKNPNNTNKQPSFIFAGGPTREARFKQIMDPISGLIGADGGVHDLFTIAGMKGAESCKLDQPDFEAELRRNNVIFRIPTPTFGAGLIEQIPDTEIVNNINKDADEKDRLGIGRKVNVVLSGGARTIENVNTITEHPKPNKNGNDGTIARFGWKAQNKSLLIFSGEAYNVEMGISNELFQTEREEDQNCQFKPAPNDATNPEKDKLEILSDIEKFASFMRLLAPPVPSTDNPGGAVSIANGRKVFEKVGCHLCHTQMLHTTKFKDCDKSAIPQLCGQPVNLFSDLALHHMGAKLDDGIAQGQAEHDEFRTAPLWGLGKRIFFLHDGRTKDLVQAIEEHRSRDTRSLRCRILSFFGLSRLCGPDDGTVASEANAIVDKYNGLQDDRDKQDLLNFLRSL